MKQRGFTLLEMLVAIAIFAMLSIAAYQVLQGVLHSDQISQRHGERLRLLQRAMFLMQRDFSQIAPRSVRDETEEQRALLVVGKYLLDSDDMGIEMVSLGWRNPSSVLNRSHLQRVAYLIKDQKLIKRFYQYPDVVVGYEPREMVLLDDVEGLSFRFYGSKGWSEQPPEGSQLPSGVEVTLRLKDYGELRRVYITAAGSRAAMASKAQENTNTNDGKTGDNGSSNDQSSKGAE
ncbi:type II secretion system minor pseudopilin GspJ [Agarivorans sp. QJM3NY_29]|uniref:type II secretion system minor pseudopilin GspJ n=1 Tax=unclassified Agarivorans TaxID=2636026 RepID=UPI003D7C5CBF